MINRIVLHWAVTGYAVTENALKHYHRVVDGDGVGHDGLHPIKANAAGQRLVEGRYAAHTRRLNSGAAGIATTGMDGARYSPFAWGSAPLTPIMIDGLVREAAQIALAYGISVSARHVLTHAEVEPTLGVEQDGKWDFDVLPQTPWHRHPVEVGEELRAEIRRVMRDQPAKTEAPPVSLRPTLRWGATGEAVAELQALLGIKTDGAFGPATHSAVVGFQRMRELLPDGVVGRMTWEALVSRA